MGVDSVVYRELFSSLEGVIGNCFLPHLLGCIEVVGGPVVGPALCYITFGYEIHICANGLLTGWLLFRGH